jgi:fluoride exporter
LNYLDPLLLLAVFTAAGVGSIFRYVLSNWSGFIPWGILTGNTFASFIAGYASVAFAGNNELVIWLVVGLAGGLSTFSSWAAATVQMSSKGRIYGPVLYTLLTLVLCSTATYIGLIT